MTKVCLDIEKSIRNKQIASKLHDILESAAETVGVDQVWVISGGQDPKGTPNARRIGSTRHDNGNAADLRLKAEGRTLAFTNAADLPIFQRFVATCVHKGTYGVGAGLNYMGPHTVHIGFGSEAVWGANGQRVNAPPWLLRAFAAGKAALNGDPQPLERLSANSKPDGAAAPGQYIVTARSGLRLREGAGTNYPAIGVIPPGTRLLATLDPNDPYWAKVDIHQDGLADGFVYVAYITPA